MSALIIIPISVLLTIARRQVGGSTFSGHLNILSSPPGANKSINMHPKNSVYIRKWL